jgi:predicted SnoaL-like aldol condensation-catalyzing enzyme
MEVFRFNDDKNIVEHRDSLQQISKTALHDNSLNFKKKLSLTFIKKKYK